MAGGLLWAAVVLGLLTWWLSATFWDSAMLAVLLAGVLAVLALGLAAWQWRAPASREAALKERRALGLMLLPGGVVLALLAVWLIALQGLPAFPEVSGTILMAVVALGAGLAQLAAPGEPSIQERLLQKLLGARRGLSIGLFVLAAVFVAGGIWLLVAQGSGVVSPEGSGQPPPPNVVARGWTLVYPEVIGLAILTLIFVTAGIWLAAAMPDDVTPERLRILILSVGGLTGLVITLATFLRILAWWAPVFGAGVRAWQGAAAWQLWVCIYAELAGLAIMFGSLLLARADVRTNAVMRRLLYGYNAALTGLLMLAVLIVLNIVVYVTYPYTFNWTETLGIHTLSSSSKNLLESLKEPARVYVLMGQSDPLYKEVQQLLENGSVYGDKLRVEYISPEQEPKAYEAVAVKYPEVIRELRVERGEDEQGGRGVLIVYGPESDKRAPHAFIPRRDLYEVKGQAMRDAKPTLAFKGEDAIMTQLRFLANNQNKPKIYFTQGNGELDITSAEPAVVLRGKVMLKPSGIGRLVDRLKKDNYEVLGFKWTAPPAKSLPGDLMAYAKKDVSAPDAVPEDAKIVVIAAPARPFSKSNLEALDRYLAGNGKLIVLTSFTIERVNDALVYRPTGLEGLLKKFNVELTGDYLLSLPTRKGQSPFEVLANVPERSKNKIALGFSDSLFPMTLARSVRPGAGPGAFSAEALLELQRAPYQQAFWPETDWNLLGNLGAYLQSLRTSGKIREKISDEPVPVALAVSDREQKPRMVVIGDGWFVSNVLPPSAPYYDFLVSCMEWLVERPANIGIKPKESSSFALGANVSYGRMILLPLGLMLLGIVGAGTGIWVVRRR